MSKYEVKVIIEYNYEVEADSYEEAEQEGWKYENYRHHGEVVSIDVTEDESDWIEDDEPED